MKRSFIFLCAAMVLLSGCGSRTVSSEAPSLTVSASAVSVYGRSYVPAQPLPAKVSTPQEARAAESATAVNTLIWARCQPVLAGE